MSGIGVQPCCCQGHVDPPGADDCETNCLEGTVPNEFELVMPVNAFNPFLGCGEACSAFAGTFVLTWFGSVGGICRWTYCLDDPCNPGSKAEYVFSYRVPNLATLLLVYDLSACDDLGGGHFNEWVRFIGGPGDIDCLATIDHDLNFFLNNGTPSCDVFGAWPPHIRALN